MTDDDHNQIEVPPSFLALFTDARQRLQAPPATVRARYELCEDIASHLAGQAQSVHQDTDEEQQAFLRQCHTGLREQAAGVSADEAGWVASRLAELLDWRPLVTGR
ncbi:MAG: hypothetical protein V4505_23425 [Pseudomonadota bacterium]